MNEGTENRGWTGLTLGTAGVLAAVLALAWFTGLWVLTAIPIGVLFGFFLQKGDLFRDPFDRRKTYRFLPERLSGAGGRPKVKFIRELVPE